MIKKLIFNIKDWIRRFRDRHPKINKVLSKFDTLFNKIKGINPTVIVNTRIFNSKSYNCDKLISCIDPILKSSVQIIKYDKEKLTVDHKECKTIVNKICNILKDYYSVSDGNNLVLPKARETKFKFNSTGKLARDYVNNHSKVLDSFDKVTKFLEHLKDNIEKLYKNGERLLANNKDNVPQSIFIKLNNSRLAYNILNKFLNHLITADNIIFSTSLQLVSGFMITANKSKDKW